MRAARILVTWLDRDNTKSGGQSAQAGVVADGDKSFVVPNAMRQVDRIV
jgi:hypothetical protein